MEIYTDELLSAMIPIETIISIQIHSKVEISLVL